MKVIVEQPRFQSLGEAVLNNAISFGMAFIINMAVLPKLQEMSSSHAAFTLTSVFTVISLIRQYIIRRLFNRWATRKSLVNQTHPNPILNRIYEADGQTHSKRCLCPDCCNSNY